MERIAQIIARCRHIDNEQAAIESDAELNNNGQFTDEQRAKYAELKAEFDALINEKQKLESDAAMKAERSGRAALLQPAILPRKSPENAGAPLPGASTQSAEEQSAEVSKSASKKFSIPAQVRRFTPRNFLDRDGMTGEERAYRFGQYCLAKLTNDIPGRYSFPHALSFINYYMGGIRNLAHGESDGTTGGHYLVPDEFSNDFIVLRERFGVARRLFRREPMAGDTKHVPKWGSGLTAYFPNESDAITESNSTFSDIQLVAKKMGAIARMSAELSADAVIDIGDRLAGDIAQAFANKEDECGFNGDGTSTYAGIRGVRYLLQNISGTTDSAGLVTASGNAWSEITAGDLTAVVGKLPQYADTGNCAWVCHRAFYYGVMEKLLLAQGGATAMELKSGVSRPRPMYLGYPVEFAQVFPSVEANSQVCVAFGDFSQGAFFGDRAGIEIMFSEHAYINSQSVFERNQIAVRGTQRFDIVVHGCGDTSTPGPIVGLQTAAS